MHRSLMAALGSALLAGCASVPRVAVEGAMLLPQQAPRLEVHSHQRFIPPGELAELPMPEFPKAAPLSPGRNLTVCVSFTVSAEGEVQDILAERFSGEACADPGKATTLPFLRSVQATVIHWPYVAAALCDYPSAEQAAADDAACSNADHVQAIPVRLAWRFVFSVDASGARRVFARRPAH